MASDLAIVAGFCGSKLVELALDGVRNWRASVALGAEEFHFLFLDQASAINSENDLRIFEISEPPPWAPQYCPAGANQAVSATSYPRSSSLPRNRAASSRSQIPREIFSDLEHSRFT